MSDLVDENKIDKVLDLSQEKTFRVRGVAAVFDSPVYDYDGTAIEFENPVPVTDDEGSTIGYASLSFEDGGKVLMADVELAYSNPERLLVQAGSDPHYLQVMGAMAVGDSSGGGLITKELNLLGNKVFVFWVEIDTLKLSTRRPTDVRITPVEGV